MPQQYIQHDRETIYKWINFIESIKQLKGISVKNSVSSSFVTLRQKDPETCCQKAKEEISQFLKI